jgi:threonine aldolase
VETVETNILIFTLGNNYSDQLLIEKLKQKNISISSMGHGKLRMVTHLDYREVMHTYVLETLSKLVL